MNDNEKSDVLPTRHSDNHPEGGAMGTSLERQMRASILDTNSCNTRFNTNSDGSVTRLRTRGGMCEYVTEQLPVNYGTCKLNMDNGVVDLIAADFLGVMPGAHDSGFLYYTDYVSQHYAESIIAPTTGPIMGKIYPPGFIGDPEPSGNIAKSFDARTGHDPFDKKRVATLCPPSAFTGKMRLYVQSLYGRHDYGEMFLLLPEAVLSAPSVQFDHNKMFGTEINPYENSVTFNTNCGVFTDLETKKHYLISIGANAITIYPMKATTCGERLRKHLLSNAVSDKNKERIEAYILSQSHPDRDNVITLTGYDLPTSSMGYGWHFNWDGNKADIVVTYSANAPGGGYENESMHYRLTFERSLLGVFSAELSTEEGPVRWKSLRHVQPITHPEWGGGGLAKIGAHLGPIPHGNAPFYVFYTRNELKVCRYNAGSESYGKQGIVREPYYYNPNTYCAIGTDAIYERTRDAYSGSIISISCGDDSVVYANTAYIDNVTTRTAPDPSNILSKSSFGPTPMYMTGVSTFYVGQPETVGLTTIYDEYWGTIPVASGVFSDWQTEDFPPYPSYRGDYGVLYVGATTEIFTASIQKLSQFITVIPFYDAEAIFLYGEQVTTTHEVGNSTYGGTNAFNYDGLWEPHSILATHGRMSTTSSIGFVDGETTPIDRTSVSAASVALLVCSTGTISDVDIPGKASFWSINDFVSQQYPTLSSAAGKAVKATDNGVYYGMDELDSFISFVGWA